MIRLAGAATVVATLAATVLPGCAAAAPSRPPARATAPAPAQPGGTGSGTGADDDVAREGRPAASQVVQAVPRQLRLPSGTVMSVRPVEVGPDGSLRVPDDVRTAGWWAGGARLGDRFGSMVLVGHVDSREQGLGSMAQLLAARPGQEVVVSGSGVRQRFRVVTVRQIDKDLLPTPGAGSPFDQSVAARLVLITCSGPFDARTRHYRDNQVVVAAPES